VGGGLWGGEEGEDREPDTQLSADRNNEQTAKKEKYICRGGGRTVRRGEDREPDTLLTDRNNEQTAKKEKVREKRRR